MTRLATGHKPSGRLTLFATLGGLVGAGALAWHRSRSGQAALEERTRSRLRPRPPKTPNAADIKIGD